MSLELAMPNEESFDVMPAAAPRGLEHNGVPQAPRGVRSLQKYTPDNGSTFSQTTNIIRIPVASSQFLDLKNAQLEFTIQNTSGQVAWLDSGCQGLINKILIKNSSGVELERIDNYNVIAAKLDQYTESKTSIASKGVLSGAPHRVSDTPFITAAASGVAAEVAPVYNYETGMTITPTFTGHTGQISVSGTGGVGWLATDADSLNDDATRTYSVQLRGAWFNPLRGEYLMPGASFLLEITLEQALVGLKTAATAAYSLTEPSLYIPSIMVDEPTFLARLAAMKSQGVSWRGLSFKSHQSNVAGGAGNATVNINDRSSNLRGLMAIARFQANLTTVTDFSISKSSIQFYSSYQYQIGSQLFPPQQVDMTTDLNPNGTAPLTKLYTPANNINISQAFSNAKRFFGSLGASGNATGIVSAENFCQSEKNHGTGVMCVNLQTYDDMGFVSGINTAAQALPINLKLVKTANADLDQDVLVVSLYDKTFVMDALGNIAAFD